MRKERLRTVESNSLSCDRAASNKSCPTKSYWNSFILPLADECQATDIVVGDVGYYVSPLAGFGASLAIIGAGHLAAALGRYPGDHVGAFRLYEDRLRPFVEAVEDRAAIDGMSMICPADEGELAERDRV